MSHKCHLILAFVAGMAGSALMHYIAPTLAFAQDRTPVATEIRAQSFALVDSSNNLVGTFTTEPDSRFRAAPGSAVKVPSRIVLRDPGGRVLWTPENLRMLPLTMR